MINADWHEMADELKAFIDSRLFGVVRVDMEHSCRVFEGNSCLATIETFDRYRYSNYLDAKTSDEMFDAMAKWVERCVVREAERCM